MGATTAEKNKIRARLGWAILRSNKEAMFVRTYFVVRLTFILSWLLEANVLDRVEKGLALAASDLGLHYDPVAAPTSDCIYEASILQQ